MKRNPKIRLNKALVMQWVLEQRVYGKQPTKELLFIPIIYKIPHWSIFMHEPKYIYQNRIMVRFPQGGMCCLRLRGKAPLHKEFTLEEFINSFYMIKDEKTNTPYFKYYKSNSNL